MQLPCLHIFYVREKEDLSLFSPNLCSKRWSIEYYKNYQKILKTAFNNDQKHVHDDEKHLNEVPKGNCSNTILVAHDNENGVNDAPNLVYNKVLSNDENDVNKLDRANCSNSILVAHANQNSVNDIQNENSKSIISSNLNINKPVLMNKVKSRGRPKGRALSVIGLNKKTQETISLQIPAKPSKSTKFVDMTPKQKAYMILSHCLTESKLYELQSRNENILYNHFIIDIKNKCWFADKNIKDNVEIIKSFLRTKDYLQVKKLITQRLNGIVSNVSKY